MESPHDVGGQLTVPVAKIDLSEHPCRQWEKEIHAILGILNYKRIINSDEFRRGVESLEKKTYNNWSYYGRWASSIASLLLEKKIFSNLEFHTELYGDVNTPTNSASITEVYYKKGDIVQVKLDDGTIRWRKPHIRVPGYIFGLIGIIEEYVGTFDDPSLLAFGINGPQLPLYRVAFNALSIWRSSYHNAQK
jgi:hypothetical protein